MQSEIAIGMACLLMLIGLIVVSFLLAHWRRNRYRFSLRGLLLSFAVVGSTLFLVLQFVRPKIVHWWAIRQIYVSGGAVLFESDNQRDAGDLYSDLTIANAVDDVFIVHIGNDREALAIADQLRHVPEAKTLFLGRAVTDVGLTAVCNCGAHPSIEIVDFHSSQITEVGLVHLTKLPKLHTLFFNTCQLSDSDLKAFSRLPNVTSLTLLEEGPQANPGRFSNGGFEELGNAHNLESLVLVRLKISDRAAGCLHSLTNLKSLLIHRCHISDEAAAALRQALPRCKIKFTEPDAGWR